MRKVNETTTKCNTRTTNIFMDTLSQRKNLLWWVAPTMSRHCNNNIFHVVDIISPYKQHTQLRVFIALLKVIANVPLKAT